jgi:hypothetical protein
MTQGDIRDEIFELIYSRRKVEEAILRLNHMIKSAPKNSRAIALKAYALNKLANANKDWKYSEQALDYAERSLLLNPEDDIALTSKGWSLIDLGRPEEALKPLEHATRLSSRNEYAWYNLAWAQYLTESPTAAKESITKALEINPGNPIIRRGREMMEKGEIPSQLKARHTKP